MYLRAKRVLQLLLSPVLLLLGMGANSAWAEEMQRWQTNMPRGVTEVSNAVYDLHMTIFWICVVIGVVVFAVMFYSVFAHRKSLGVKPADFHESTKLEIAWTIVPFIILIVMAVPATKVLIEIYDSDDADMDVVITGYQWRWKYEYLNPDGENVVFFSNLRTPRSEIYNQDEKGEHYLLEVDEPLVLPVDTKVRFLVTANDVIHSWWVPAFAVKRDAIPGFVNEAWTNISRPGIYRGMCAELCGRDHAFMPIVVHAMEREEYEEWYVGKLEQAAEIRALMEQEFTLVELVERGRAVYERSCVACHGMRGEGGVGPAITGSPYATGEMEKHVDVIVNGVPGTSMQAFGAQLSEVDLAAVITYQRNSFGNNMGDLLQPIDVYQFKQGQ